MERVERIKHMNVRGFCAQGIVSADGTTHMYIQADLKTKEQALGKLQPLEGGFPRFKTNDALLAFLSAL